MKRNFLFTQLVVVSASVLIITGLFVTDKVMSAPTAQPPSGNPSIPAQPPGPKGPTGDTGSTGSKGPTGDKGVQGLNGEDGYALCNFSGYGVWVSHGIDGGCAFSSGVLASCGSGKTITFARYADCGVYK
jgi:hypothetical protein